MVEEKGLDAEVADKIGLYVKLNGSIELLDQLCSDQLLTSVKDAQVGLEEMKVLLKYSKLFGVLDNVRALNRFFACIFCFRMLHGAGFYSCHDSVY